MINIDVKNSIIKKISALFPTYEIYDEKPKQGMVEPCFFVKVIEQNTAKQIGNKYKMSIMFDIHYFLDEDTPDINEQYHSMAEVLYENFEIFPYISSGYLKGLNKKHDIKDDVLHFFLDVDVFVRTSTTTTTNVLMATLNENNYVKE